MTVKQTDRAQITAFGARGRELFDQIEAQTLSLVEQIAGVNYEGQNAFEFKTNSTTYAVTFANTTGDNMRNIAQTITEATTYIATALGGAAISLEPPVVAVTAPAINADTSVETAEDGPLIALRDSVEATFANIESGFAENLGNFQNLGADGWIGPEYDAALADVQLITTKASEDIQQARTTIAQAITNQLQAVGLGG
ncbi:MAG: hypothetical protein AAGD35_17635 [Actinomycetota bacterium]